jgi:hypothetical protein
MDALGYMGTGLKLQPSVPACLKFMLFTVPVDVGLDEGLSSGETVGI